MTSFFEQSDVCYQGMGILPQFDRPDAVIVFSVDNFYLDYLLVTIYSLLNTVKAEVNYDVNILHVELSEEKIKNFLSLLPKRSNFKVRFISIRDYVKSFVKTELYIEIHVSAATYYRFFISDIFRNYDRVVYLDSDLIIREDIFELMKTPINGAKIAAVPDVREQLCASLGHYVSQRNWREYVEDSLGLGDYHKYFQAGVLIFNIDKLQQEDTVNQLFGRLAKIKTPILSDQDVLNSFFCNDVYMLPTRWNVEWQIPFEYPQWLENLKIGCSSYSYPESLSNPSIIHYASPLKPWNSAQRDKAYYWWTTARQTPIYEKLLEEYLTKVLQQQPNKKDSFREIVNTLLPIGSARRTFFKAVYSKLSKK